MMKRIIIYVFLGVLLFSELCFAQENQRPNVIIIMTDDQGYVDLGITGNPHVQTPVIDSFGNKSIRFNNFYVSPVCAPTRSSLMTGRYSLRTGMRDTYNGGSTMASNEVTIAEMLKQADYKTGVFGKWHLGNNYPSRPSDQGFDESLIHLSGGMGQVGNFTTYFKGNRSYFDPVLWHNNEKQSYDGYCSDIFANNAIDFIEENKDGPFFCYLPYNATIFAFKDLPNGGGLIWKYKGGGGLTAPVLTKNKIIFGSSANPFMTCLNPRTGELKWRTHVGGTMLESVPSIYGDKVFALIKNGYLYAIK